MQEVFPKTILFGRAQQKCFLRNERGKHLSWRNGGENYTHNICIISSKLKSFKTYSAIALPSCRLRAFQAARDALPFTTKNRISNLAAGSSWRQHLAAPWPLSQHSRAAMLGNLGAVRGQTLKCGFFFLIVFFIFLKLNVILIWIILMSFLMWTTTGSASWPATCIMPGLFSCGTGEIMKKIINFQVFLRLSSCLCNSHFFIIIIIFFSPMKPQGRKGIPGLHPHCR